ncbi:beta-lactamase family protein [Paenibacillus doosanensis]|uniref:serine hydrolase domain-containing protein n=1 Tax=Paenibacillus doosanensis TaxID=1229154 RepID=UPI00217FD5E6|nr:serine hydrolase [Paenibacillus doosanensis]MCS7463403.1 beta-lactamase family protein [Paenibacillus doosanensis]
MTKRKKKKSVQASALKIQAVGGESLLRSGPLMMKTLQAVTPGSTTAQTAVMTEERAAGTVLEYSDSRMVRSLSRINPPDYWPTEGWRTASPEERGMDSAVIADMVDQLKHHNVHSFVLIRDGYLVAEGYNKDWDAGKLHPMFSVTKSFTSALVGMALEQKVIRDLNQPMKDFIPEIAGDSRKARIKVSELLSMISGIDWDNTGERSSLEMTEAPNWGEYIWSRPMAHEPGTAFKYSNGDAHLLSILTQRAFGFPLSAFAKINLFDPLGITSVIWNQDPQGHLIGSWGLKLTPRDMAKLGFLYLHKGRWENYQLLRPEWVEESVQLQGTQLYDDGTEGGFGYLWWLKPIVSETNRTWHRQAFYAAGSGGQRIFVVPDLNLVMAMTANNEHDDIMPERMMVKAALAVKADRPLSVNEIGAARLRASLQAFKAVSDKAE